MSMQRISFRCTHIQKRMQLPYFPEESQGRYCQEEVYLGIQWKTTLAGGVDVRDCASDLAGNLPSIPRKVQAIVLGPLRTPVTDDHCMLHWFCGLVAWPCYCYRKRLTPENWLVFKITTLACFARYRMVKLHTNQFSGVNLLFILSLR